MTPDADRSAATVDAPPAVRLSGVSRWFGSVAALDGVDLELRQGEFFALLGPSGSGKTTCLRLIAGFDRPTAGAIEIFGERCEDLPPNRRDVSTVFQDYALFPHMSVLENVAFALRVRGTPKAERRAQALEMLATVRLESFADRRPSQLSGGQRQRVALARSLMTRPKVLLLDEPLGALDLKLREQMQVELKHLQRTLGVTFVFVTHDQGEALALSDRLAVFDRGRIAQIGSPEDIYERPATRFVADFVGGANMIAAGDLRRGTPPGLYTLRPEKIRLGPGAEADLRFEGVVASAQYQGGVRRIEAAAGQRRLTAVAPSADAADVVEGARVVFSWRRADMHRMAD